MPIYSQRPVGTRGRPPRNPYRPKRKTGMKRSMMKLSRPLNYNSYFFKRKFYKGAWTLNNLTEVITAYTFKLTDLPNYTEFTNLFDRYRILKVAVILVPQWTTNDLNPVTTTEKVNPAIYSLIDYTEDAPPASLSEFYEDSQCKITRGGRIHKRVFTPSVLCNAFETVTTSAYTPKWKQWITTDDPATPHYSIKLAGDKTNTSSNNFVVKIFMTYYFQCKDLK